MKKVTVFLLAVCMLLSATGCSLSEVTEKVFTVDDYQLQITADSTFREDTMGEFDLQICNGDSYVSIMAYEYIDLPEGKQPIDVFDLQKEDISGRRTNVERAEELEAKNLPSKVIAHEIYSGEREGIRNYYGMYLLDFPEAETFAWVLVSAMPSYYENNSEYLNNIVCSIVPVG